MRNMQKSREIKLNINSSETETIGWHTKLEWVAIASTRLDMKWVYNYWNFKLFVIPLQNISNYTSY
jgi:hypothetical protein